MKIFGAWPPDLTEANVFRPFPSFGKALIAWLVTCHVFALAATETVLHNFGAHSDGSEPAAGLVLDSQGNLYGTTLYGGLPCLGGLGCGVVFQLRPSGDGSWTEYLLYSFSGTDGERPNSTPVFDTRGNLYSSTAASTTTGYGNVFELTPQLDGSWKETILHAFTGGPDGGYPHAVALDAGGRLYGTTSFDASGYAGVFSLTPISVGRWYELVLHSFSGVRGGDGDPVGRLTFDAYGNIYGTTYDGGANGAGTVFKLTPSQGRQGWTETVLYAFQGTAFGKGPDGANPYAGLVFDGMGNLYGTTEWGGASGLGTIFRLKPNFDGTWTETLLYAFQGGHDGGHPRALLTLDDGGSLYGTTTGGIGTADCPSPANYGTVFKLTPGADQWNETVLYEFQGGLDGNTPVSGVVRDSSGNLYGTTVYGGTYGSSGGVVYEITP